MNLKSIYSRRSKGDLVYDGIVLLLGLLICFLFLYPLWYVFVASFSKPYYVADGEVVFWINHFTLGAYKQAFSLDNIWTGFGNAIIMTVFGTMINIIFTTTLAYALSRKELPFRRFFNFMLVFTMLFSAGMIPFYRTIMGYHLMDSYFGAMIAFAISAFNVLIMRSFFEQVSSEYEEAARIDGAGTFTVFFRIFIPLSVAAIATITLFSAVGRWNGYFWSSIMFRTESKQPLQVILRKLLVFQDGLMEDIEPLTQNSEYAFSTISYAIIVITVVPMLVLFPFIQKYFRNGVTLGGVKG